MEDVRPGAVDREIPERGVSGIERGHHLQRERQLALRAFQIAGLEEDPSPVLSDR